MIGYKGGPEAVVERTPFTTPRMRIAAFTNVDRDFMTTVFDGSPIYAFRKSGILGAYIC
jgi:hypothetical protein